MRWTNIHCASETINHSHKKLAPEICKNSKLT